MASIKGQVFHMIDSSFSPGQDKRNYKSHGDLNHWNLEVQTPKGNITNISDYIPQKKGKPIRTTIFDKDN